MPATIATADENAPKTAAYVVADPAPGDAARDRNVASSDVPTQICMGDGCKSDDDERRMSAGQIFVDEIAWILLESSILVASVRADPMTDATNGGR